MSQFEFIDKRVPIALDNPSIYHDISKCKNCTLCRRACADVMSVLDYYDLESTGDVPMCIHCGQCASTVVNVRLPVHLIPCMLDLSLIR